jgi:hypothetical protein
LHGLLWHAACFGESHEHQSKVWRQAPPHVHASAAGDLPHQAALADKTGKPMTGLVKAALTSFFTRLGVWGKEDDRILAEQEGAIAGET